MGKTADTITALPSSGSYRQYYRMKKGSTIAMGAYNPDEKENTAFLSFSRHFHKQGLPVPAIYAANEAEHIYLLEDLGDTTLFSFLSESRSGMSLLKR